MMFKCYISTRVKELMKINPPEKNIISINGVL